MARNTNSLSKKLLTKDYWYTKSLPIPTTGEEYTFSKNKYQVNVKGTNEYFQDSYIKVLIHGTFFKLGILTSQVRISKNCLGETQINFLYFNLPDSPKNFPSNYPTGKGENKGVGEEANNRKILNLIKVLKLLLNLKYPNNHFKFVCVKAPHKFIDSKLLNDYIFVKTVEDPNRAKYILTSLTREYRALSSPPLFKGGEKPYKIK